MTASEAAEQINKEGAKVSPNAAKKRRVFTPLRQRFIDEMNVDHNATQAAIRAGYSAKTAGTQGSRLLQNVDIAAELEENERKRGEKIIKRVDFDAERVLKELANLSTTTLSSFIDDDGFVVADLKNVPQEAIDCVSEILQDETELNGVISRRIRVKLHDRVKSLALAGKHRAVQAFVERVEVGHALSARLDAITIGADNE